jgi:predicted metal-dependent hydrolase
MSEVLTIEDLQFELRRSPRRKTVGITVDRDGSLILYAPACAGTEGLERVARRSRLWVYRKLAEQALLFQPRQQKEWVTGESFYYLGRSYRLLIVPAEKAVTGRPLRLYGGRFELRADALSSATEEFRAWYSKCGETWIGRRVELLADRVGGRPTGVEMRDLGYRWGSCGAKNRLYFHWQTMCLPPGIIEYIVVHEMVHLLQSRHDADFWARVERIIPDCSARKQWLADHGGAYL